MPGKNRALLVGVYRVVGAILPAHREVARGTAELSGHWPELAAEHLKYIEHVSQNIYGTYDLKVSESKKST